MREYLNENLTRKLGPEKLAHLAESQSEFQARTTIEGETSIVESTIIPFYLQNTTGRDLQQTSTFDIDTLLEFMPLLMTLKNNHPRKIEKMSHNEILDEISHDYKQKYAEKLNSNKKNEYILQFDAIAALHELLVEANVLIIGSMLLLAPEYTYSKRSVY
jgi:hypothetical protein